MADDAEFICGIDDTMQSVSIHILDPLIKIVVYYKKLFRVYNAHCTHISYIDKLTLYYIRIHLFKELLYTMCLDYRELHTSIKRSSRHPYSINSGSKCCAIYPSLFCSIRQLYRLCCCAIDSKQIGEAGRLRDRKEHRGFADWTEGGSCCSSYSRWTNDEGKYSDSIYVYVCIYVVQLLSPKGRYIWTLTTQGDVLASTKEAYVRHACASVALFVSIPLFDDTKSFSSYSSSSTSVYT